MRILLLLIVPLLLGAAPHPSVKLWRIDCGTMTFADANHFSDSFAYPPGSKTITDSCYLVEHGSELMLWDAGIPADFLGGPHQLPGLTASLKRTIRDQLREAGIAPARIATLGISHMHLDHIGQAADFAGARLLIGAADWTALANAHGEMFVEPERLAPWIERGGAVEKLQGDKDVFGDGSVVMLALPGHTPGHYALLVRVSDGPPVLLTGDLYHLADQRARHDVMPMNSDRAATLASFDRFDAIARNLHARVVIQHEPGDIGKLPDLSARPR